MRRATGGDAPSRFAVAHGIFTNLRSFRGVLGGRNVMRLGFQRKTAATGARGKALQGQTSTIVIADDHPLFRGALRQAIGSIVAQTRVLESTGLDELQAALASEKDVDLILLDLTMPGVQG